METKGKVILALTALFGVLVILGNIHFINGSNVGFKVVGRDSFGFSEMFINVDQITGMPYIAAQSQYPLGCRVLARVGIIESPDDFHLRIQREAQTEMRRAMEEAKRQQEAMMRAMGY